MALAAVPGDPFKLGKVNIISNAATTPRGDFSGGGSNLSKPTLEVLRAGSGGPALRVQNQFEAGGIIGGQGIQVQVAPGKAPLQVNSSAGKASELNADELDGRDQEDFLSASRIYEKTALKNGPGDNGAVFFSALDGPEGLACDGEDVAIDASANAVDINDDLNQITRIGPDAYQIEFQDNAPTGSLFRASVICSDSSTPFRDQ